MFFVSVVFVTGPEN